jgi:hypothetical protein
MVEEPHLATTSSAIQAKSLFERLTKGAERIYRKRRGTENEYKRIDTHAGGITTNGSKSKIHRP